MRACGDGKKKRPKSYRWRGVRLFTTLGTTTTLILSVRETRTARATLALTAFTNVFPSTSAAQARTQLSALALGPLGSIDVRFVELAAEERGGGASVRASWMRDGLVGVAVRRSVVVVASLTGW